MASTLSSVAEASTVDRPTEGMAGLAKGLAIIEAFALRPSLSVADAARCAGTSRAAARRCLLTLGALGYVTVVGQRYAPSSKLRRLGQTPDPRETLATIAQPHLSVARDRLGESVSLAILEGDQSIFIARAEAEHIVSTGVKVGASLPVYCSATGRVLLSEMAPADIKAILGKRPLPQRCPNTIVDPHLVIESILVAHRDDYAISNEEIAVGMRSLAVPVRGSQSKVIAALSVSASSARIRSAEMRRKYLPILHLLGRQIGEDAKAYGF